VFFIAYRLTDGKTDRQTRWS